MNKKGFHQLYAKPILFVGLLLLLAGIYSYTRVQTNLFPHVSPSLPMQGSSRWTA